MNPGQSDTAVGAARRHQKGTLLRRVDKRGRVLFVGRVRDPRSVRTGRRRMLSVSSVDEATAAEKLDRLIDDLDSEYAANGGYSTAGWLRTWLDEIHVQAVKPSTIRNYASVIEHHIIPAIGDVPLVRLQPHHLRRLLDGIPTSCNAVLAAIVMRRALVDAITERLIDFNPMEAVRKPKHTAERRAQLTTEQARHLLRSTAARDDPFHVRWASEFLLGPRPGEVLGLQWDYIDLDAKVLDLAWQLQPLHWVHGCTTSATGPTCGKRKGNCPQRKMFCPRGFEHIPLHKNLVLSRPKTAASKRDLPILPELARLLTTEKKRAAQRGPNPHGLVFHEADGRPVNHRDDDRRWRAALAAADLPYVTRHTARATAATLLEEAGVDEATRMQILGHVSATAHRRYVLLDDMRLRTALSHLDQLLQED